MQAKVYPKTNISKVYYQHLVDQIEHDPLIKHTTLTVAGMLAAICILSGALLWYIQSNPGNLIQSTAKVTGISSGKTDTLGNTTTFISFEFDSKDPAPVSNATHLSVRQPAIKGLEYAEGQQVKVGYHPKNPNFARLLNDTRPPRLSVAFWAVPVVILIWLVFVALFRHHARQVRIWDAAEAANSDD